MNLYPFQIEGVRNLTIRRIILLGDEMGLGKTVQSAIAIKTLFCQDAVKRVLIVCPSSLCFNWKSEVLVWAGIDPVLYQGSDRHGMLEGNARILIGSYETVTYDLEVKTGRGEKYIDIGIDLLIVDEAQRIKDAESLRSKILTKLIAPRRWAISGTPVENHPRELGSILRFLDPNEFSQDCDIEDVEKVFELSKKYVFRRTKSQVGIQIPEKTIGYIPLALEPDQAAEYAAARFQLIDTLKECVDPGAKTTILLEAIQKLRRLAVVSSNGSSSKMNLICEEVEKIVSSGEKVVIFSSFVNDVLPVLAKRLEHFGSILYTGEMSLQERQLEHLRFTKDSTSMVMCASLRAAGVGLTWTVANHIYHLDSWWNPQVLNQADDRVHRIGQTRKVFIRRLISIDTIEEAIQDLLTKKEDIFDIILGGSRSGVLEPKVLDRILSII